MHFVLLGKRLQVQDPLIAVAGYLKLDARLWNWRVCCKPRKLNLR